MHYNDYDIMANGYYGMDSQMSAILAVYVLVLLVMMIFWVVSYIFKGIGMYQIAKREGKEYPWLAFVPFARVYLQGQLAGPITFKTKTLRNPGIWLLVMPFAYGVVLSLFYLVGIVAMLGIAAASGSNLGHGAIMAIFVMMLIFAGFSVLYQIFFTVVNVLVNYQIFGKFTTKNMSVAHAVISTTIPLYESFCMFVLRNHAYNPGMEPKIEPFVQPYYDPNMRPVEPAAPVVTPAASVETPAAPVVTPVETPAAPVVTPVETPAAAGSVTEEEKADEDPKQD